MATAALESMTNLGNVCEQMGGVKELMDTGLTNSLPDKYVFPQKERPSADKVLEGKNIPVIDISGLDGSEQERTQTIHALAQACTDWGFFRVINHGIQTSLIESMLDVTHQFFSLSPKEKMEYGNRDVLDPVRYGTSFNAQADQVFNWRDYLKHFCHPVLHTPDNPPNYRNVAGEYFKKTREMALKLMAAISESLGLHPTYIESVFKEGFSIGIVNFYPACPQPELTMGIAPHSDHGGLTILLQNEVGGLQVRHKDHWVAVEAIPNTFVVNVCDHLEIMSNGRYKSVEHRAVVNPERTRISIATTNGPALDALIYPAPQLIDETHTSLYKSMLYGEYLRLQQSGKLIGKGHLDVVKIPKQEQ